SAVIRFNITGYKEFALKQPKPYHLFVLLSANQGVGAHTDEKDPVFFGVIDAYTNSEIQRVHELKAVPLLVHFGPKSALTKKKRSGAVMIKSGDQFRITKYDHTPEDFLEWMNQKTTRDVKVFRTSHEKLS
ncbi:hypothetical protein Pmar_PMAR017544, partial [Perkinsus marinus ATCC 50983]